MHRLVYFAVCGAFICHWAVLAYAGWLAWRHSARRSLLLGISLWAAIFSLAILATRDTTLRGGYANEHDFHIMSSNFMDWNWPSPGIPAQPAGKELSARAMMAFFDFVGGFSMRAILVGQKCLWAFSALLTYAALRNSGASRPASILGAGMLAFNFLTILNTYTFSTTNTNVFYVASSLAALLGFFNEESPPGRLLHLVWFLLAAFLVFTSRFEFFPVIMWGFALALYFGGGRNFAVLWRGDPTMKRKLFILAGVFSLACAAWGVMVADLFQGPKKIMFVEPLRNLTFHLGEQNLSMITGLAPGSCLSLAAIAMLALGADLRRERSNTPVFRALFLAVWILYFGLGYPPVTPFKLHSMRHHLYIFLPFVFLFAWAVDAVGTLTPPRLGACFGTLLLPAMAAYFFVNVRQVWTLQSEWRTNDREWQFLYAARETWPAGCRVLYPFNGDRGRVLEKYFPFQALDGVMDDGCYLTYRSAIYQIFDFGEVGRFDILDQAKHEYLYEDPWRDQAFLHRHYMNSSRDSGETLDPIVVRIGMYRLKPGICTSVKFRLLVLDSLIIQNSRSIYAQVERQKAFEVLARAQSFLPEARKSLEFRALGRAVESKFLNDRGVLAASVGRTDEAVQDLREALGLRPDFYPAYMTLGSIYGSSGRLQDALKVYDAALARPAPRSFELIETLIRKERSFLLKNSSLARH